jgi:8-oxo-dGTP diphosphatase
MTKYVVGLVFDREEKNVVLLEKQKPEWQKGRLNGPGGKIEENEEPIEAMTREFLEETGLLIPQAQWELVVLLQGEGFEAHFFTARSGLANGVQTMEKETVYFASVENVLVSPLLMPNLKWIIPLAIDPCCSLPLVISDAPSKTSCNPS